MTLFKFTLVGAMLSLMIACQASEFSGDNSAPAQQTKRGEKSNDALPPGSYDPSNPNGMTPDNGGNAPLTPQICDASNIRFVSGSGQCPAGSAAYVADDSRSAALACCPLPAMDIIATGTASPRGSRCGINEVAVGVSGNSLLCAPINTERYSLRTPSATCYYGNGASGGNGAAKCTAPSAVLLAMTQPYGVDACLPVPYGGLITSITSKYCKDVFAAQLVFAADGMPVPMFK